MDKVEKIIELLENGQHKEALSEYNEVLNKGNSEEKFSLAEQLLQYGFLEEAKALLEDLLLLYPGEGEIIVLLAEIFIETDQEEKAILLLEQIGPDNPVFGEALLLMADLYQLQGLFEVSEMKLKKAKELLPDEPVIDFALGELYSSRGEMQNALECYQEVLKEQSEIAGINLHQRLADTLSATGNFEEAIPHYEKALKEHLEINTLFGYAFTALQAGLTKIAIEKFNELKELDPEYHSLYMYLAKAYEAEEDLELSHEAVKEGIRQDEFNKDLYFFGGKIALKLGKETDAETYFREAIALDPGFTEAALMLNKLFIKQERFADVTDLIGELDIEENEEPQFLWDAAIAWNQLEDFTKAKENFEAANIFYKDNELFLKDYGYFLIEEGKTAIAAEVFNKLLKHDPTNEEYADIIDRLGE